MSFHQLQDHPESFNIYFKANILFTSTYLYLYSTDLHYLSEAQAGSHAVLT